MFLEGSSLKAKMGERCLVSIRICLVAYGADLITDEKGKAHYMNQSQISGSKFCEIKNIERYLFTQEGWLNYTPGEHYNPILQMLFENKKLMFINVVRIGYVSLHDNEGFYNSHTVNT